MRPADHLEVAAAQMALHPAAVGSHLPKRGVVGLPAREPTHRTRRSRRAIGSAGHSVVSVERSEEDSNAPLPMPRTGARRWRSYASARSSPLTTMRTYVRGRVWLHPHRTRPAAAMDRGRQRAPHHHARGRNQLLRVGARALAPATLECRARPVGADPTVAALSLRMPPARALVADPVVSKARTTAYERVPGAPACETINGLRLGGGRARRSCPGRAPDVVEHCSACAWPLA